MQAQPSMKTGKQRLTTERETLVNGRMLMDSEFKLGLPAALNQLGN